MKFNVSIFMFVCLYILSKKCLPYLKSWTFYLTFSLEGLQLQFLFFGQWYNQFNFCIWLEIYIHTYYICIYIYRYIYIYLHKHTYICIIIWLQISNFSKYFFKKNPFLIILASLSNISWPYMCDPISKTSLLFHWSVHLSLCQYYTITVSCKIKQHEFSNFFLILQNILVILDLLCFNNQFLIS